jgi:putative aminopeptidase FrvX
MNKASDAFLDTLLKTPSPTGRELAGQKVWLAQAAKFADETDHDAYGNCWATLKGNGGKKGKADGPRVMLEAHADEIGFMVTYISEEGFISIVPTGGSDRTIVRAKRLRFLGDKGDVIGVFGNTAIHLRKDDDDKQPQWQDLFIDLGAKSKQEVLDKGVRVGTLAVFAEDPIYMGSGRLTGRAIDNRISGYILTQVLERLAKARPKADVIALNAIQEEIGGNGARVATYRLFPDLALVFDVTHATDHPGLDHRKHGLVKLGAGPTVTHGTVNHPLIVERLMQVAEKEGIPLQHEASSRYTGTDTDDIFTTRTGVPAALVSIPLRYMHSPVEICDMEDVENTVKLVVAFVKSLKAGERFSVDLKA